ncbi:hypothetical protein BT96DRAFT_1006845 [Gymnopus androsaceus JB14]|uniref:Uncharacterized protein n=1 Tax=Gymnopus androsaceus JB14 TaxID=1447944 RepID=A0A6A4GJF8_9AGAR|nr:hypothetical protein BT96DRAFT_1006845 [Gymnopus androsaceus JB14]
MAAADSSLPFGCPCSRSGWTGPQVIPPSDHPVLFPDACPPPSAFTRLLTFFRSMCLVSSEALMAYYLAAFLARPAGWKEVMEGATKALDQALLQLKPPTKCRNHQRGDYVTSKHNAAVLEKVLEDPYMQRFARFVDCGMQAYFPQIHCLLHILHSHLSGNNPELKQIFPGVGFAACHLNLGASTHQAA